MRIVRVAMCQIFSLDGDRQGNFSRVENAISEAKDAGADIACFPEAVILGWVNPDAHERAYSVPGKDSDCLCDLAKNYDAHLCIGLAEKSGGSLYDSAVLIDPPYTPGEGVGVVETRFGKIGLLICADTHKSEILKRMTALKPDLLLIPYGYAAAENEWPGHGKELEKVVRNTAKKTGAFVIGTNLVGEITKGPWTGRIYGGHSVAVDKTGRIISIAKDRDRDVNIVSINIGP